MDNFGPIKGLVLELRSNHWRTADRSSSVATSSYSKGSSSSPSGACPPEQTQACDHGNGGKSFRSSCGEPLATAGAEIVSGELKDHVTRDRRRRDDLGKGSGATVIAL